MSQENVEFLHNLFAGPESADKEALLAALPLMIPEVCDPEIEWVEDPTRADGRTYRGHEGVRDSFTRWLENFEQYRVEVESITDHGDRALVQAVEHGRGSASAADVSARIFVTGPRSRRAVGVALWTNGGAPPSVVPVTGKPRTFAMRARAALRSGSPQLPCCPTSAQLSASS